MFIADILEDSVCLDSETTGIGSDDEIIELGITDSNGKVLYESLFHPSKPIPYSASKVNHIYDKDVKNAPHFYLEWNRIKAILKGKRIIIHNATFDVRMVKQTLDKYGVLNEDDFNEVFNNVFDSMKISMELLGIKKLISVSQSLGIEIEQTHRATDDCQLMSMVLGKLKEKFPTVAVDYAKMGYKKEKKRAVKSVTAGIKEDKVHVSSIYLDLFKKHGQNLASIATERNVKETTVKDNLLKLYEVGDIAEKDVLFFIQSQFIDIIKNAFKEASSRMLKDIKSMLPPEVTYETIKYVKIKYCL